VPTIGVGFGKVRDHVETFFGMVCLGLGAPGLQANLVPVCMSDYSYRSATDGSTRAALRAGI
jgi:hypothetical protein